MKLSLSRFITPLFGVIPLSFKDVPPLFCAILHYIEKIVRLPFFETELISS